MLVYRHHTKPIFDKLLALAALLVLSPLCIVTTIVLFFHFDKKVFWAQYRIGLAEKRFKIRKFKTMRDWSNPEGHLLPDEDRTTNIGRFLRTTGIDEIPQLLNVLNGEMSLVGPRPLLEEYLTRYPQHVRAKRHTVRPGITGLAQINGGNSLDWAKRFELDLEYIDNQSLLLDASIMLKTLQIPFANRHDKNIGPFEG